MHSQPDVSLADHISMYWMDCNAPYKHLRERELSPYLIKDSTSGERFPARLRSFPATARFLIGQPASSAESYTVLQPAPKTPTGNHDRGASGVGGPSSNVAMMVSGHAAPQAGLSLNRRCHLDVSEFGKAHTLDIHPLGTSEAFYAPNEFQASFTGGQYVNVGFQKVWKRRPAVTHKKMILSYSAKPHVPPHRMRQV